MNVRVFMVKVFYIFLGRLKIIFYLWITHQSKYFMLLCCIQRRAAYERTCTCTCTSTVIIFLQQNGKQLESNRSGQPETSAWMSYLSGNSNHRSYAAVPPLLLQQMSSGNFKRKQVHMQRLSTENGSGWCQDCSDRQRYSGCMQHSDEARLTMWDLQERVRYFQMPRLQKGVLLQL